MSEFPIMACLNSRKCTLQQHGAVALGQWSCYDYAIALNYFCISCWGSLSEALTMFHNFFWFYMSDASYSLASSPAHVLLEFSGRCWCGEQKNGPLIDVYCSLKACSEDTGGAWVPNFFSTVNQFKTLWECLPNLPDSFIGVVQPEHRNHLGLCQD